MTQVDYEISQNYEIKSQNYDISQLWDKKS